MRKLIRPLLISGFVVALMFGCFRLYNYSIEQTVLESQNICQDDELIARLIVDNINPFSKLKFIKKRNTDCKVILIINKDDAEQFQKAQFCSFLDASTNSVTMLINAYVHEMYDRESASKEFKEMVKLMTPYNYCPQYLNDMSVLIKIKKRLGL